MSTPSSVKPAMPNTVMWPITLFAAVSGLSLLATLGAATSGHADAAPGYGITGLACFGVALGLHRHIVWVRTVASIAATFLAVYGLYLISLPFGLGIGLGLIFLGAAVGVIWPLNTRSAKDYFNLR